MHTSTDLLSQLALWNTTASIALLVLLLGGVLVWRSKQKVLRQRWTVWLMLFVVFGASTYIDIRFQLETLHYLSLAIVLRMMGELTRMLNWKVAARIVGWLLVIWIWFSASEHLTQPSYLLPISVAAVLAWLIQRTWNIQRLLITWVLFVWLTWLPMHWHGAGFFALFLVVALFDIGGWVGGNSPLARGGLGRAIAPKLSPNKTWAGVLVGSAFALVAITAINSFIHVFPPIAWPLICVLSVGGDLVESTVKRRAGVKDAGAILPGFGGLLDRFDSMLFASWVLTF